MSESTRVLNGGGGVASGHHDNNIIVDGWKRVAHINMKAMEQVQIVEVYNYVDGYVYSGWS